MVTEVDESRYLSGRLLLGWLDSRSAAAYGPMATAMLHEHGAAARAEVTSRLALVDDGVTAYPWPDGLSLFETLVSVDPGIVEADLKLCLVKLATLRVRQVAVTSTEASWDDLEDLSLEALANLTVPVTPAAPPVTAFDEHSGSWILRADDSSIEVVGRYNGPVDGTGPASQGFGFIVSAQPSRLEIWNVEGRLVIMDGHHRALRLFQLGVEVVPALVRTATRSELRRDDGVAVEEVLGDRAPRLCDYLDDDVSVEIPIVRSTKVIVLQANEFKIPSS